MTFETEPCALVHASPDDPQIVFGGCVVSRIRTLKPSFGLHEELSRLPPETHLLAAVLPMYADDEGFFRAHPRLVQSQCLPLREDSVSVEESLELLQGVGYLALGVGADGKRYGHITNFLKHQRVNRFTASSIKETEIRWDNSATAHQAVTELAPTEGKITGSDLECEKERNGRDGPEIYLADKPESLLSSPEQPSSAGREPPDQVPGRSPTVTKPATRQLPTEYSAEFLEVWEQYPKRAGANPKTAAFHGWKARIAEGFSASEILAGVERYAAFVRLTGKAGTEFVMQAKTFLGPDHHFLDAFDPPRSPDASRNTGIPPSDYKNGVDEHGGF